MPKSVKKFSQMLLAALAALLLPQGCSLVDENEACPVFRLDYEMRLVTNLETELQTSLSMSGDVAVEAALRDYLRDIFTDYAHDAVLSFYNAADDDLYMEIDTLINGNQTSIQLKIRANNYHHTAVANIRENGAVDLEGKNHSAAIRLKQKVADTIPPHRTGLFTEHLDMNVYDDRDQVFSDTLRMVNCAAALVVDTLDSHIRDIRVVTSGFATEYSVYPEHYSFDYTPIHRTDRLDITEGSQLCFVSVNFPSFDPERTKSIFETTDPFVSEQAGSSLWRFKCYVTLPDGSVTESILGVRNPIRAGQLRLIKVKAFPNGSVQPSSPEVGVSVDITWNYNDLGGESPL